MTIARHQLIQLSATPYYHVYNRCVRRAFLCGFDRESNCNYEHRKQWIIDDIAKLQHTFCIQIAAYSIMSNHYHLVVHINKQQALDLSHLQVVQRWQACRRLPEIIKQWLQVPADQQHDHPALTVIEQWRERLYSISWLMRLLNQSIAYRANQEDQCTGRFWEGRFKSQALLDEKAVLQAMAYVDLNPIRAKLALTPEQSKFTSIQQRIHSLIKENVIEKQKCNIDLLPFETNSLIKGTLSLPIDSSNYLTLIDWTGRAMTDPERGFIPENVPPILSQLDFRIERWIDSCATRNMGYYHAKGKVVNLRRYAALIGQFFVQGVEVNKRLFEP